MIFHTRSGSIYQVDFANRQARALKRMNAQYQGHHRLGPEWRPFYSCNSPEIGEQLVINWGTGTDEFSPEMKPHHKDANLRYTTTSPVVKLEPFMPGEKPAS